MIDRHAAASAFDAQFLARAAGLDLRAEEPSDAAFLRALFLVANPLAQVLPPFMLEQQADIRLASFRDKYPLAMRRIFLAGGAPIGRIIIDWTAEEGARVADIGVRPEHRGRGVASAALTAWQDTAAAFGLDCRLTVLPDNPARALYRRLGFVEAPYSEADVAVQMYRRAPAAGGGARG